MMRSIMWSFSKVHPRVVLYVVVPFLLMLCSCAQKTQIQFPEYQEPHFVQVNMDSFDKEVRQHQGYALVMFYNGQYEPSLDMERRFEYFSARYGKTIKFCKFYWDIKNDRTPYDLEMLPTVDLYENGYRLDRIKGIPELESEQMYWNDDIDLWILKNVYKVSSGDYGAEYVYKFKNSAYLQTGNY